MTEPGPSGLAAADGSDAASATEPEIRAGGSLAQGFGIVPNAVWRLTLGNYAQALYVRLVCYVASGRGACYPGQASLADDLGCSERSVRNAMDELRERGLLEVHRRGRNLTNIYTVHGPEADRPPGSDEGPAPRADPPTGTTCRSEPAPPADPDRHHVPGNKTRGAAQDRTTPHPPTPAPQAGQGSRGRRGSRATGDNPRALAAEAAAEAARGPEPDPPTAELTAGWHAIRSELEAAVGDASWNLYLQPLELAGHRGTELVLTAPEPRAAWITERFGRLLAAAVRTHLGPDTTVTVQPARAAAAA